MTTEPELRADAPVYLRRALGGMVTPELRGVTISVGDNVVRARMIYEREPTDDERELVSVVETELIADFPPEDDITVVPDSAPPPAQPDLLPGEEWVYRRPEPEPTVIADQAAS
jgi:hypothetical protein